MENPIQVPSVPGPAQNVLRQFNGASQKKGVGLFVVIGIVVVALGIGGGFLLSSGGKVIGSSTSDQVVPGAKKSTTEAGIADEKSFPDTATGNLKTGGLKGEGTHHLERDGGASQNVYLTSTVIDLESFSGKKVQVWGQTVSAKNAGWLMDVGKIKVVE